MKLQVLAGGEELHLYKKALVLRFPGPRTVCSTGLHQGGTRRDITAVFNHDGNPGPGCQFEMKAPTYEEHLRVVAQELGLEPERATGLCTAASMDNRSIQSETFENLTVTAIVTGGIQKNGGRIGDPAAYLERLGTINILLCVNADLNEGGLARALVSVTEAKVAALQELLAPSRYSHGLATGSGTDGVIVIANPESALKLTDAGTHSKLGELIGRTVKKAVKEALERQTGLNPAYQHDVFHRMDRFGVTEDSLWEGYQSRYPGGRLKRMDFEDILESKKREEKLVTFTSLYAHLLDQLDWGLLSPEEVWSAGAELLRLAGLPQDLEMSPGITVDSMAECYAEGLLTYFLTGESV